MGKSRHGKKHFMISDKIKNKGSKRPNQGYQDEEQDWRQRVRQMPEKDGA